MCGWAPLTQHHDLEIPPTPAPCCRIRSSFLTAEWCSRVSAHRSLLRPRGLSPVLPVTNKAAVNIRVKVGVDRGFHFSGINA